ncbi:MAG: DUF58 domain-containing protein, partial [Candidatus Cloacimonadaceae bacterium]
SELELPSAGILRVQDAESGRTLYINSNSQELRNAYKAKSQLFQKALEERLQGMGCDHIFFQSSESYVKTLRRFFFLRTKGRQR